MPRSSANAAVSVERFLELSVLGLATSGYLAVAGSGYLDTPTIVLAAMGLAVRALLVAGVFSFRIPPLAVTLAALAYIGFIPVDYYLLSRDFLATTVHLVFFLTVATVLTARTTRGYVSLAVIAFVELLAAAVLSASLTFLLFLALYLLFAIAAFTSFEIRRTLERPQRVARGGLRRFHVRLAALACFIACGILSLTGGLFFLLPRTASAALDHLVSRHIFLPGFSDHVSLGEIGTVKISSQPVMHVRVFSDPALAAGAKWRGAALADFNGRKWSNPPQADRVVRLDDNGSVLLANERGRPGTHVSYRIDLNAVDTDTLFFAGLPEVLEMRHPTVIRTVDDNFRLVHGAAQAFRYKAWAFLADRAEAPRSGYEHAPAEVRSRYLQLPQLDPRIAALAQHLSTGETTDAGRARAIESGLRREYGYTLELPRGEVADPLANFLFVRRKGHCEYFASAMTVMLRTQGIPARLVNGFQSGIWNPFTELYVIRASDAHSWVEAWLPGRGWTTFDPTPPEPARGALWTTKLALYLDAADTFWREWVLGYDLGRQAILADRARRSGASGLAWFDRLRDLQERWTSAAQAGVRDYGRPFLLAGLSLGLALWMGPRAYARLRVLHRVQRARQGYATAGDATLLYVRMLEVLKRRGYFKPAWFTPAEFASTLPLELRAPVVQFTTAYNAVRFGADPEAAPRLPALLDQIEGMRA